MRSRFTFGLSLGATLIGGCSAVVSPISSYNESPFACLIEPELRVLESRSLTLRLGGMEPHGSQMTAASVVNAAYQLQANVIVFPTGAGALGPRRLRLDPSRPDVTDGNLCALADATRLDLELRIENVLPPDPPDSTRPTFQLDFWSDLNRNGRRDPAPLDHVWGEPICDNGDVRFAHNIMFDAVIDPDGDCMTSAECAAPTPVCRFGRCAADAPDFRLRFRPTPILTSIALLSQDPAITAERLARLPFVVAVSRQGHTVGYFRTELECLQTDRVTGEAVIVIPDIVDGGAIHDVQMYLDTQRNGVFDAACDPECRDSVPARAADDLEFSPVVRPGAAGIGCMFPDEFSSARCRTPE
jgi:hypothetical protein